MSNAKLGLIGIVNEHAKTDFWATMKRVGEIGYQGIESGGPLLEGNPADNLKRLNDLGLQLLTVSARREGLRDSLDKIIADAHALKVNRVSCWWGPCESREQLLHDAELYNTAGKRLAAEGLKLAYHNHNHEFRTVFNGVRAFDILADHTDPAAVHFVIDIAWVAFGGADPVAVLNRLGPRTASIHVKDVASLEGEKPTFTAVGTGVVNIPAAVRAALANGVEWAVVEQDRLRNLDAWQTLTLSYLYMKETELI